MRQCPKCGKSENEIEMTTMIQPESDNTAKCPCSWVGTVGALIEEKKAAPAKIEKVEEPSPIVEPKKAAPKEPKKAE